MGEVPKVADVDIDAMFEEFGSAGLAQQATMLPVLGRKSPASGQQQMSVESSSGQQWRCGGQLEIERIR